MNIKKGNLITAIRCLRNRSKSVAYSGAFALYEIKKYTKTFLSLCMVFQAKAQYEIVPFRRTSPV